MSMSSAGKPRPEASTPGCISPVLSRGETSCPSICWFYSSEWCPGRSWPSLWLLIYIQDPWVLSIRGALQTVCLQPLVMYGATPPQVKTFHFSLWGSMKFCYLFLQPVINVNTTLCCIRHSLRFYRM